MDEEPLDPILLQVTIALPVPMIFGALTDAVAAREWLCDDAEIDARVGGVYRLTWRGSPAFTSHGRVLRLTTGVELDFSWESPGAFEQLMNSPELKTHVYIRLQESPEGVDVTLEHEGWGAGDEWSEARSWHFHFWDERLQRLKEYLTKAAYG